MKPALADLVRLIDAAEIADSASAFERWSAAELFAAEANFSCTADGAYLHGYVYYQLHNYAQGSLERAEELLLKALALDPKHAYAHLYLGHIAFDEGSFAKALAHFNAIAGDEFSRKGQTWRDLKRQELRICCLLQLRQVKRLEDEFEQLLQIARGMESDEALLLHEFPRLLKSKFTSDEHAA